MILGPLVNNMPSLEKPKLGGDDNTDVVRGLVREFLDMLGDGEAETHAALSSHVYITALLFCHRVMENNSRCKCKGFNLSCVGYPSSSLLCIYHIPLAYVRAVATPF